VPGRIPAPSAGRDPHPPAAEPAQPEPRAPRADDPIERQVWWVAAVVVIGSIMSIMATTIVNVALDRLSIELHASLADIQWVVTGYLLGMASVIPAAGWAVRRFGGKRLYLASVLAFVVASLLCAIAWSTASLVAFRVLQGIAGGFTLPVGQMMLARAAGPHRMGRVMSVVGVPMVLGPVLGPVLGGLIVDNLSWHWIFVINVPFGIAALALGHRCLPVRPRMPAGPLDVRGLALCSIGVPLVIYGLSRTTQSGGWTAPEVLVPVLVGVACLVAFAMHALRTPNPLLDVRLLGNAGFGAAVLGTFCVGGALFGAMLLLPLYFQTVRGESALNAGLLLIPQALGAAVAMPLTGRLADRVGGGRVAVFGVALTALATIPLALISATTSYSELSAVLFARGLGIGGATMPMMAAAYATLRPDDIPHATPQLNVSQRVGGSVGTAVLSVVLSHGIAGVTPTGGRLPATAGHRTVPPHVADGLARAFGTTYWWAVGITAVALLPALLLAQIERRSRAAALVHEREGLADLAG
jgi:EmrB/QacA subfamily drug resistance transporter